eukprot:TRINITY_DN420_c1_g1_i1.p1 TRINITY_DN420_c1_g1~~TRINITY_DN420_c1_g1_i1.p1  ORF type:complete len:204 (+),score=93.83 TRINITY_DN420_c1_g1_i1:87-698(+)
MSDDLNNNEPKKSNFITRTKKKVASGVATSSLGKRALPVEARALLKALKKIINKVEGGEGRKLGTEIENIILKILVKAKIHADNHQINISTFAHADRPLRQAFEILNDCFDYYGEEKSVRTAKSLSQKFSRVEALLREVETVCIGMLSPLLKQKSVNDLRRVFNLLADKNFLEKAWATPDLYDELFQLVNAMNLYTQFHIEFD